MPTQCAVALLRERQVSSDLYRVGVVAFFSTTEQHVVSVDRLTDLSKDTRITSSGVVVSPSLFGTFGVSEAYFYTGKDVFAFIFKLVKSASCFLGGSEILFSGSLWSALPVTFISWGPEGGFSTVIDSKAELDS